MSDPAERLALRFRVLIPLLLFMAMEGRLWKQLATLSAGIGFGLSIDELGKSVTADVAHFFQPAVAFMYLVFAVPLRVAHHVLSRRSHDRCCLFAKQTPPIGQEVTRHFR